MRLFSIGCSQLRWDFKEVKDGVEKGALMVVGAALVGRYATTQFMDGILVVWCSWSCSLDYRSPNGYGVVWGGFRPLLRFG